MTTNKKMQRRLFLRGLGGVALGLPFLESVLLRGASRAQNAAALKRFVVFFECNGVNMNAFWPASYGALNAASFGANQSIAPLAPYASKILIPRGIHMVPRGFGRDPVPGDDHAKGMGCKLTARTLQDTNDHYADGVSVDQEIARRINPMGRPPLTLRVGGQASGVLGSISYVAAGMPAVAENNPWLAYQDFVGLSNVDDSVRMRIVQRRQSVLDLVTEDFDSLKRSGLSQGDQDKLDMHFSAIRDVEQAMAGSGLLSCTLADTKVEELMALDPNTIATDAEFKRVGRLHMDVLAIALACDYTRVATLQWGNGAGGPVFRWDGMNHDYNHHKLSHGNTRDDCSGSAVTGYEQMLFDIDRWFAGEYAYLLDRLSAYDEGGASVLDNSAVVWMNELSDGRGHDFRDLPVLIAGSAGGYLKQGQYIKVTSQSGTLNDVDAPHNQLLTTFLNAVDARQDNGSPYTDFGGYGQPGLFQQLLA